MVGSAVLASVSEHERCFFEIGCAGVIKLSC